MSFIMVIGKFFMIISIVIQNIASWHHILIIKRVVLKLVRERFYMFKKSQAVTEIELIGALVIIMCCRLWKKCIRFYIGNQNFNIRVLMRHAANNDYKENAKILKMTGHGQCGQNKHLWYNGI